MTSEQEVLQRAKKQMSEENFTAAEQSLLQAMTDLPPNLEIYNLLMEIYYKVELFSKVPEYFKQATIKFPDLNLNSYFMVSDNLLKADAIKECEMILLLAQKNHPEHVSQTTNKLLELYMHPATSPLLLFNFIKNNYCNISIPTDLSIVILNKLFQAELLKECQEFFIFMFNTSMGDIHRKKVLLKEYLPKIKDPAEVLVLFEKLKRIGLQLEPAIYFSLSSYLILINAKDEAKQILEEGIENEPKSELLFKEALELIHETAEPNSTLKKLDELSSK